MSGRKRQETHFLSHHLCFAGRGVYGCLLAGSRGVLNAFLVKIVPYGANRSASCFRARKSASRIPLGVIRAALAKSCFVLAGWPNKPYNSTTARLKVGLNSFTAWWRMALVRSCLLFPVSCGT